MKSYIIFTLGILSIILLGCSGMPPQTKEILMSPQRDLVNYALSSNGATAESPDSNPDHPPSEVIDGDISSLDWDNGGGWEGNLSHLRSDELLKRSYIQVNLPGKRQIKRIVVYTIDSPKYPAKKYGLKTYTVEAWYGSGWKKIDFTNDSKDKRYTVKDNKSGKIIHDVKGELVTDKIRIVPYSSNDTAKEYDLTAFGGRPIYEITGSSKVIEIEAWGYPSPLEETQAGQQNNLSPIGKSQPSPDEKSILKVLFDYEQGYDNENLEQVMSVFADNFTTLDGKSRSDIEKKASEFFEEYNSINMNLNTPRIEISPSGETAIVEASYDLECIAKSDNNVYKRSGILVFNFQKDSESNWKVINAK